MRTIVSVFVCCLGFASFVATVQAAKDSVATVSPFDEAPTLDGQIKSGEWDGAVRTTGFMSLKGNWLEKGMGATYCGFTRERLYVAIISELPPDQKLLADKKYRDSKLIQQDSFEIWLDPYEKKQGEWKGGGTYFQSMGIANGTISDTKFTGKGAPNKGWDGNWSFENGIHKEVADGPKWAKRNGIWVAELSIPFEDLGWEGDPVGRSIGVLVARNFKRARGWKQVTWFPHKGSFVAWQHYPEIKFTENEPAVQIEELGENVLSGQIDLKTRIYNPGPKRQAKVDLKITSSDMPKLTEEKTLDLPAADSVVYEYSVPAKRLHETAKHTLNLEVSSPEDGTEYLDYFANIKQRGEFWRVRTGAEPKKAVRLAYYPSYEFIKVKVDTRDLKKAAAAAEKAAVTVTAEDDDQIFSGEMSWDGDVGEERFDIGAVEDGEYTVTIDVSGGDYERSFTRTFRRKHFEWENNNLGISKKVYEPFEPIQVEDREVSVVMRDYQKGELGFWESIEVVGNGNTSQYRELLTGPITLKAGGVPLDGEGKFTSRADHKVVYKGSASNPAVQVNTRTITEYDGCMRVEMMLQPGEAGEELEGLTLEIPFKDELAPLFHCTTTALRRNPSQATPEGKGRIWDSRDFPDGEWYGNFHPYIWIGGPERGISWFADNDKGWVLDAHPGDPEEESVPCQELIRRGDTLTLRINLVQKPVTLEKERKIVFGLMASPAKPMREDWRKILFNSRYKDYPKIGWLGSTYGGTGGRPDIGGTYPLGKDMSILNKMQEMRLTGGVNKHKFVNFYMKNNEKTKIFGKKMRKRFSMMCRNSIGKVRGSAYFNMYWEEFHAVSRRHPETKVFGNEWSGRYGKGNMHNLPPSYIDFQCWYGAEYIRRGVGLYFDNTFPKRTNATATSNAYRLPNGSIQPSANMWRHREYLKRIWTLHKQLAPAEGKPIMMLHMTNTHIVPYMVWNQANLNLEWFYGPDPQQSKYPADLLRTEAMGLQTGNLPLALASIKDCESKEQRQFARRTRFGTLFVHEIKWRFAGIGAKLMNKVFDFGYVKKDCKVYNYWDPGYPVETSNSEVKSILLERNGKLLLVLATWNGAPETVQVTLDGEEFDKNFTQVVDAETQDALNFQNNTVKLDMQGYGVRMLRIE